MHAILLVLWVIYSTVYRNSRWPRRCANTITHKYGRNCRKPTNIHLALRVAHGMLQEEPRRLRYNTSKPLNLQKTLACGLHGSVCIMLKCVWFFELFSGLIATSWRANSPVSYLASGRVSQRRCTLCGLWERLWWFSPAIDDGHKVLHYILHHLATVKLTASVSLQLPVVVKFVAKIRFWIVV